MGYHESIENFYSGNEESYHITKHIVKAENDYKTLDVKIIELKENPDNLQLLFDIMAMVFNQEDQIKSGEVVLKDIDVVHYVLAKALKANLI